MSIIQSSSMSFDEFVATRREVADLRLELPHFNEANEGQNACPGYIYDGSYFIETASPAWTEEMKAAGRYYLIDGNVETITDDLTVLERLLWHGYVEQS